MVLRSCGGSEAGDAVIFCGSGSTAAIDKLQRLLRVSGVAEKLRSGLSAADRPVVFVGGAEHHSNLLSWRESICDVEVVPIDPRTGLLDLAVLERGLAKHRSRRLRMGSFSACSNVTGIVFQVEAITRLLHREGALSFWDYAGGGAYLPIKMSDPSDPARDPDAVFLSPHKFIGGAGGVPGVLVAKRAVLESRGTEPTFAGGGTVRFVTDTTQLYSTSVEEREEGGTPAVAASIRCGLVFRLKDRIGVELIHERERAMVRRAAAVWRPCSNIEVLGGWEAPRLAFFSFLIRAPDTNGCTWLHHNFVTALLSDVFGIQSRGGCSCAGPYGLFLLGIDDEAGQQDRLQKEVIEGSEMSKPGWTRINLNFFISDEEVDYILEAVRLVATYGYKLLPFYHCEPDSGLWKHKSRVGGGDGLASLYDFELLETPDEADSCNDGSSVTPDASGETESERHAVLQRQLTQVHSLLEGLSAVDVHNHKLSTFGGQKLVRQLVPALQSRPGNMACDTVSTSIATAPPKPQRATEATVTAKPPLVARVTSKMSSPWRRTTPSVSTDISTHIRSNMTDSASSLPPLHPKPATKQAGENKVAKQGRQQTSSLRRFGLCNGVDALPPMATHRSAATTGRS